MSFQRSVRATHGSKTLSLPATVSSNFAIVRADATAITPNANDPSNASHDADWIETEPTGVGSLVALREAWSGAGKTQGAVIECFGRFSNDADDGYDYRKLFKVNSTDPSIAMGTVEESEYAGFKRSPVTVIDTCGAEAILAIVTTASNGTNARIEAHAYGPA